MSAPKYRRIVAVDFDGTLAETRFPEIIKPIPKTIEICKALQKNGAILILWTCRCGKDLEDAVEWCKTQGLVFDLINENVPENVEKFGNDSRKIFAHEYIDDKATNPAREIMWTRRMVKVTSRAATEWVLVAAAGIVALDKVVKIINSIKGKEGK